MAMELRQQLRLSQQLVMTPQLQQAIKLLQLSRLELVDAISQELEENPALEEIQETAQREAGTHEDEKPAPEENATSEVKIDEKIGSDIDWDNYLGEYNSTGKAQYESEQKEAPKYEAFVSQKKSLDDHLLWQLLMTCPDSDTEEIGCLIIGNLSSDGYLTASVEEIAEECGHSVELVEDVLEELQTFDPPGICARNLGECLLIQARHFGVETRIMKEVVTNHIKELENKNYKAISKALKVGLPSIISTVNIIKEFESKPGRPFSTEEPHYITPDIYVYKEEGEFIIALNDDGMPRLRVNPYYRQALSKGQDIPSDTRDYLQDKMRSAAWLIKSIHQRQKTIYSVMESILKFQAEFFEKGISHLKPMVLRDVAQDIGMHESTISRVTTNKYAYTPQGIFELKYFFNSSINRVHGAAIASASVQDKIKQIIDGEDTKKPYSDEKIAQILKKEANVDIARRTVAKYREAMKILPSSKRKQF